MRNNRAAEKRNEISMADTNVNGGTQQATGKLKSVESLDQTNEMERGLSNRHVQFIAIGGTIGTVSIRQENVHSYSLYFVEEDLRAAGGGDALRAEERTVNDGALSTEELAGTLMSSKPNSSVMAKWRS